MEFVQAGGYQDDALWTVPSSSRLRFLTSDGQTMGPADWPIAASLPAGGGEHPVTGLCFLEAQAFVRWCNRSVTIGGNWTWSLPPEELWEFAARGEAGLTYPWGDAFDVAKCNSAESGIGKTSEVTRFESGVSPFGCCDMAGNVWEFVLAADSGLDWCVLRGGSFKNTSAEVRSYLRLDRVPRWRRPPDFGFRLLQIESTDGTASAAG
jgi:formylglycine-generating enzyme required for sulfatase activity